MHLKVTHQVYECGSSISYTLGCLFIFFNVFDEIFIVDKRTLVGMVVCFTCVTFPLMSSRMSVYHTFSVPTSCRFLSNFFVLVLENTVSHLILLFKHVSYEKVVNFARVCGLCLEGPGNLPPLFWCVWVCICLKNVVGCCIVQLQHFQTKRHAFIVESH